MTETVDNETELIIRRELKEKSISKEQKKILKEAFTWIGTPYKYAGQEKGVGTDCSGFIMKVFEETTGKKLPRNSKKQSEFCKKIKKKDVRPTDLVFFATGKDPATVSHVGMVVDNESFIHASSSKGVIITKLDSPYFQRTFIMFGRIPEE